MSMNLAFEIEGQRVDFPFQTPTNLSYAVMKAKGLQQRLDLIEAELKGWEWDKQAIDEKIAQCRKLLSNKKFKLVII